MTKIRKQKKRKVYRYDVNRKKMKNKQRRRPKVQCDHLKSEWDKTKTAKDNLKSMGLTYDVNQAIQIPKNQWKIDKVREHIDDLPDKSYIAEQMEIDAKTPREKKFRLPNSQVHWLSKLIDKYGDDYEAMQKDRKLNYFQDTWRQLKAKIRRFEKIPEQYNEYLKKKQLLET